MKKTKSIIINLRVPGLHCWPEAPKEVSFLAKPHRHMFYITCEKRVKKNNREIEILLFQSEVTEYMYTRFGSLDDAVILCDFKKMSCEDIAETLFDHFNLLSCTVLEDGENGARIQ